VPRYAELVLKECIQCGKCGDGCDFMQTFGRTPTELADEALETGFRKDKVLPYSCNICGYCQTVCPKGLDIGLMLTEVRERLISDGEGPLNVHLPAVQAEESAVSEDFWAISPGKENDRCQRVFMPGCSLSRYSSEIVQKTYSYLVDKLGDMGIVLTCCGGPSHLIGNVERAKQIAEQLEQALISIGAKEIITACPFCTKNLSRYFTKIRTIPLYPVLMDLETGLRTKYEGTFSLHDPCTARDRPDIHDAVRFLIVRSGSLYEEPEHSRDRSQCCGMGGMVMLANPLLAVNRSESIIRSMDHDIVTYCCSCRNMFSSQGARAIHLLDLLFSDDPSKMAAMSPNDASTETKNLRFLKKWVEGL
jgi:Fe-S oxidoreductase